MRISPAYLYKRLSENHITDVVVNRDRKSDSNSQRHSSNPEAKGTYGQFSEKAALSCVCFGEQEPAEDRIRVACTDTGVSKNEIVVTYGIGPKPDIHILDNTRPESVLFEIQEIFRELQDWFERLTAIEQENGMVQSLLQESLSVVKGQLCVIGMDYKVIAATEGRMRDELSSYKDGFMGTTEESYSDITSLKQDPVYYKLKDIDGVFFYPGNLAVDPSYCINLKRNGETAFRLMINAANPEKDGASSFLLEILAPFVSHALSYNLPGKGADRSLQHVILTFLSLKDADYMTISSRLEQLGWPQESSYFCLVLKPSAFDVMNMTLRTICGYLENTIPGSAAVAYDQKVVMFVCMAVCPYTIAQIEQRLSLFIRDSFLKAGYSRTAEGHFNLRRQYEQALIAIETGERLRPDRWIFRFRETALFYILDQAEKRLPAHMLCHEGLLKLIEHDRIHGTEYAQTLRVYLDNSRNAVRSAKELYIHRSTFLYRIDRIRETLGSDFDDPDEVLYLMLSFRLLDNEKRRTKEEGHSA